MIKGLNLARCGTRNMFEISYDILPQGGRPTFISIVRYKVYIIVSECLWMTDERHKGH